MGVILDRPLPWDLLLLCTAGFFVTAVARTHIFIPGASALRPTLIFAALGLVAWLASHKGIRSVQHFRHPLGYLALFILLWAGLSITTAFYGGRALAYYLDEFARVMVLFFVMAASVRNLHDVRRLLVLYALGAVVYATFATTPGVTRGIGGGGYDPNDSAMFIVSGLSLVLYFLLRSRGILLRALLAVGFLTCCAAVVVSGSRGAFLALLALIVYITFFYRALSPALRLGIVALLAAGIIGTASGDYWERMESITDEDDYNRHSITGRKQLWNRGVGYMVAKPVLGVGLANFSVAEGRHPVIAALIDRGRGVKYGVAHSMWVEIGAELGIPGFIAFVGMFLLSFKYLFQYSRLGRAARAPPHLRQAGEMAGALIGVLVALAIAGTFLSRQYHALVWGPFGLVLGFLKVAPSMSPSRPPASNGTRRRRSSAVRRSGRKASTGPAG